MMQRSSRVNNEQLSNRLLKIKGVSAVDMPKGEVTIFLEEDSEAVRRTATRLVKSGAPDARVSFIETGAFSPY